jgi:hypothetical protein
MPDGTTLTMETREEPRFVKFSTGEVVEGTLIGIERIKVNEKMAVRYTVEDDGELVSFLGTYQLNVKIRPDDRGHKLIVRCVGEDTMVKRGENCMKVFEVQVSKERVRASASAPLESLGITDDDIPF